jgi:prolyl oligopeptidase
MKERASRTRLYAPIVLCVVWVGCSTSGKLASAPPAPPTTSAAPSRLSYPSAEKGGVVDDYHGTRVPDPYRWLEKADDAHTAAWVDAENRLTRSFLDRPERDPIKARITELLDYPKFTIPTKKGNRYFLSRNSGLQNQSVDYVQEGLTGKPRVLLDPNALSPDGTIALSATSPTEDGSLFGYAISKSGSDRQEIFVRDVASGVDLPDKILWAKFSGIAWSRDNTGFYYTRYPTPGSVPAGEENYFPKLCYHRLGEPQEKDRIVFEKPGEKEVGLGAAVTHDGRWLLLFPTKGASNKTELWVQDLAAPPGRPVPVFRGYENGYSVAEVTGGRLFTVTDRDAPRGRVLAVDLTTLSPRPAGDAPFREVVPQTKDNLDFAQIIGGKLILEYLRNSSSALEIHSLDGRLEREVPLPGIGSVTAVSGEPDASEMFFAFESYTQPRTSFRCDLSAEPLSLEVFEKTVVKVDSSRFETEQVWYPSKDGTRISMFLVHRKGLAKDGQRPVFLYGYGGFQINLTPSFAASYFLLLERDGIIAIPNLRGGSEYGEDWHRAGMREKKQNVFDDFIAAAQWLIQSGFTRREKLAIDGASNGGLLVAAVLIQRPELVGAAVCQVPVADMLRFHRLSVGSYWISEYGSSDDPQDFSFLYRYSPYHNVHDGTRYPATLVTTADTDDRVDPGHAKKLAARLQAATAGQEPILIRIETKAGHGAGKPTSKRIDESADIWTFVFWRLGLFG